MPEKEDRMIILLTNDDGIHAKGINLLFDELSTKHEIYMIAPSEERSACSNAITMRSSLTIRSHDERKFSVDGFPADCVNIGLHGGLIPEPDLVVSGINHGPNMGDDIYYSGTVAGARVGFIHGKSGIAVSLTSNDRIEHLGDAAEYVLSFIESHADQIARHKSFFNINYPAIPKNEIAGTAYTFLDKRSYKDSFIVKRSSQDERIVQLEGTVESARIEGSDYDLVNKGYVSVTPLKLDSTDYDARTYYSNRGN